MREFDLEKRVLSIMRKAYKVAGQMALLTTSAKNRALDKMAESLLENKNVIVRENKKDLASAYLWNYPLPLMDRLILNDSRIEGMAQCLRDVKKLKDPVGVVMDQFENEDRLKINKVRTPIGVVGIIYESRPNVTSDCIGLCLKGGNAVVLKGGKEAFHSNKAIFKILKNALKETEVPVDGIQLIDSVDREAVAIMLKQNQYIDVIIPRGGEGLIDFVANNSSIPVIKHAKGLCHTYVSNKASLPMAKEVCINAKVQRPGVCNAMETLLVHQDIADNFLQSLCSSLIDLGVEIRGDAWVRRLIKGVKKAGKEDWDTEYLDMILSIKVVKGTEEAMKHINTHGSKHSDAIITEDKKEADFFVRGVDSACLYVNASTRFTDGYAFGFGAEVGISTDKLHARGPMALEELTTYKYIIYGNGQIRK